LPAIDPPVWQAGYRPAKIRITYTGTPISSFNVRDHDWSRIAVPISTALASLEERDLAYVGVADIYRLEMFIVPGQTNISAIEFLLP